MNILKNWQAIIAVIWLVAAYGGIPTWLWLTLGRTFKEGGALS